MAKETPKIKKKHVIGTRHGITLAYQGGDLDAVILATAASGSEWSIYRRHVINGQTGRASAMYNVLDFRGDKVGTADTLAAVYEMLSDADAKMQRLIDIEKAESKGQDTSWLSRNR